MKGKIRLYFTWDLVDLKIKVVSVNYEDWGPLAVKKYGVSGG